MEKFRVYHRRHALSRIALSFLAGCGKGEPVIKIGFVAPLTGDQAAHGTDMLQGAQLALESTSPDKIKLAFAKNNVINPRREDHIKEEWAGYKGGERQRLTVFTPTRAKGVAHAQ